MTDTVNVGEILLSLLLSGVAVLLWAVFLVRVVVALGRHREKRHMMIAMAAVGLLASLGGLASALAGAHMVDLISALPTETLLLVASMGRGALLMGGLMLLLTYHAKGE